VIACGDIGADLISALFTGTHLDVAATDQVRPIATATAIPIIVRICPPSASRTQCDAKVHRVTNDQSPAPIICFGLFSQEQPLPGKLLVLLPDKIAIPLCKLFAFRRVGAELFGSWLHVKPPSNRSVHQRLQGRTETFTKLVM
jgi:hypothetical protein